MLINVVDAQLQTLIFLLILGVVLVATVKKVPESLNFTTLHTNELKGVAILMVIFAHTAFALSKDTSFLYPLSLFAGVGVNIFLFLSGFGLTTSGMSHRLSLFKFYTKRFTNIFIPMWLASSLFYFMYFILLRVSWSNIDIFHNYIGYFPVADIHTSFNSPLWYFTFICFYYVLFPLVFSRRYPVISIALVYLASILVLKMELPVSPDVLTLYKLHILAFPLGMLFAVATNFVRGAGIGTRLSLIINKYRYFLLIGCIYFISYFAIHSGIGESVRKEQFISILTVLIIVAVVLIKNFYFTSLALIGEYSYEIYLIQWPLMYRFDYLYKNMPASVATALYLLLFLVIAKLIRTVTAFIKSSLLFVP